MPAGALQLNPYPLSRFRMRLRLRFGIMGFLLPLTATPVVLAQTPDSAAQFTQRFYDYYLPMANAPHSGGYHDIPAHRRELIGPRLLAALDADEQLSRENPGDIVGPDFDYYVNSQDPCDRYVAGASSRQGENYLVPVYAVCDGKRALRPALTAIVQRVAGRWVFADFLYPDGRTLAQLLRPELDSVRTRGTSARKRPN